MDKQGLIKRSPKFIYSLSDPITNEIRYIGMTGDLMLRYAQHCLCEDRTDKSEWDKYLKSIDQKPVLNTLQVCQSHEAKWAEALHICNHLKKGANLLNKTSRNERVLFTMDIKLYIRSLISNQSFLENVTEIDIIDEALEMYFKSKGKL